MVHPEGLPRPVVHHLQVLRGLHERQRQLRQLREALLEQRQQRVVGRADEDGGGGAVGGGGVAHHE